MDKMFEAGIDHVIVNVHHFPDQIIDALRKRPERECICVSDERAYLRDTAGGIKFAEHLWNDCELILLYNVDILSDINLNKLIHSHIQSNSEATLAVRHRQTQRYFLFEHDSGELCGWRNVKTGEKILTRGPVNAAELAFSGIHAMSTNLARCIPSVEKSSVTGFYLAQSTGCRISAYIHDEDSWCDVGKYDQFRNFLS